jgi:hypothetical protein
VSTNAPQLGLQLESLVHSVNGLKVTITNGPTGFSTNGPQVFLYHRSVECSSSGPQVLASHKQLLCMATEDHLEQQMKITTCNILLCSIFRALIRSIVYH